MRATRVGSFCLESHLLKHRRRAEEKPTSIAPASQGRTAAARNPRLPSHTPARSPSSGQTVGSNVARNLRSQIAGAPDVSHSDGAIASSAGVAKGAGRLPAGLLPRNSSPKPGQGLGSSQTLTRARCSLCWSLARRLPHIVPQAPARSPLLLITTGLLRGRPSLPAPNTPQQARTAVLPCGAPCSPTTSFKRWIGRRANGCVNERAPGTTKSHRRAQSQAGTALTRADGSVDRRGEDVDVAFPSETELELSRINSAGAATPAPESSSPRARFSSV